MMKLAHADSPPVPVAANGRSQSVLLVIEPGVDGAFRYVEQLAHFLMKQPEVRVHLAYSSVRGSPDLHVLAGDVARGGGRTLDLRTSNAPRAGDLASFVRLRRLARAVRPDVIHAHCSKAGALARALAWTGVRARYFYTPHAYYLMHDPASLKKRVCMAVERLLAHVGVTLHTSESEAAFARHELGLTADRQRTVLNGVDCERYRPAADLAEKQALRRRFGLPPDAWVFGTVARYSVQKDPLTLYAAVVRALGENPGSHFAHVGRGELAAEAKRVLDAAPADVRARVLQVERSDELPGFYRMLDVFLLPSRYEGYSLSLLEALATGPALILSECPGNLDLKDYALDAVQWVPVGDPAQLADRMLASAARGPTVNNHREFTLDHFAGDVGCRDVFRCYTDSRNS